MRRFSRSMALVWLVASTLACCGVAGAGDDQQHAQHDHSQHQDQAAKQVTGQSTEVRLTDARVLNQDGTPVRFKSDVVGERIVVVDFVYTTCTTVCPVVSALFRELQGRLGADMGKDVALVSVSVDPLRDTPKRLKEMSAKYDAGSGWTWITGQKPQVDEVLKSFGAYTSNFDDHPPLVMVGDARSGKWVRFFGFPSPDQVMGAVNDLRASRQKARG
jgi:protein SCO1